MLNLVVEGDLQKDLGPLLVDVGHHTSEQSLGTLMLHYLWEHSPCGAWELVTVSR